MKYNKIFAVALAALAMTACSDPKVEDFPSMLEGGINTNKDVTVSLPTTFTVNENEAAFNIPVSVLGNPNGNIQVTVAIQTIDTSDLPADTEQAKPVEHFNLTSATVNIPKGESTGYLEFTNIWKVGELNDDRVFELEITSVRGATIGNYTCFCTIANVDDPYTAMCGQWVVTADEYLFNGTPVDPGTITIETPDPVEEADYYGSELYGFGFRGVAYVYVPFGYEYDEATQTKTMTIMTGQFATTSIINFGFNGVVISSSSWTRDTGSFGADIPLTLNDDETVMDTPSDSEFLLVVMPYPDLNAVAGYWGGWQHLTFTRK